MEIAAIVAGIKRLIGAGTKASEIAVLVRINAQLPPIEDALTRASIPYTVRGQRFYQRNEVREARQLLRATEIAATGGALVDRRARPVREAAGIRRRTRRRSGRRRASGPRRSICC